MSTYLNIPVYYTEKNITLICYLHNFYCSVILNIFEKIMINLTKYEYYINSLMQFGFAIPIIAIYAEKCIFQSIKWSRIIKIQIAFIIKSI